MRNTEAAVGPDKPGGILWPLLLAMMVMTAPAGAFAQELSPAPGVDKLLEAIVGIRARVPEDARTAQALGTQRVGSGVVIDASGLIVTIGYLILEASHVQVMVADNTLLDAEILAYDHDTGFGLLRASEPLDVTPMVLGESSGLRKGDQLLVSGFGGRQAARPEVVLSWCIL